MSFTIVSRPYASTSIEHIITRESRAMFFLVIRCEVQVAKDYSINISLLSKGRILSTHRLRCADKMKKLKIMKICHRWVGCEHLLRLCFVPCVTVVEPRRAMQSWDSYHICVLGPCACLFLGLRTHIYLYDLARDIVFSTVNRRSLIWPKQFPETQQHAWN